jgi:hypothetical protein
MTATLCWSGAPRRDATCAAVGDAVLPRAARESVWEDVLRCATLLAAAPLRPLTARPHRPSGRAHP